MKARSELNRRLDSLDRQIALIRREVKTQPAPSILAVSEELHTDLSDAVETFAEWIKMFREESAEAKASHWRAANNASPHDSMMTDSEANK